MGKTQEDITDTHDLRNWVRGVPERQVALNSCS